MKGIKIKYIFYFSSVVLLILMLILSKNAGISCDEILHYDQSVSVYNYFATHGNDQSALNTPVTNLKYYGQSFDNIVTIITKWLKIDDVYGFRNMMSSLAGWCVIFITALFAVWLTEYRTGIIVLILYAVSPVFLGHAQNNLKDIPFALGYISAIYFIIRFLNSGKKYDYFNIVLLTVSIAFAISIRSGGLILLCYLFFFFFLLYSYKFFNGYHLSFPELRKKFFAICVVTVLAWGLSIILWPWALNGPVKNVLESYKVMAHFPGTFRQIFEGKVEWSDFMPWYYLPKSMLITIPLVVLTGLLLFFIITRFSFKHDKSFFYALILFTILFPLLFVIYQKSNVYSSWRQFLFLYPGIVLLASIGYSNLFQKLKNVYLKILLIIFIVFLSVHPLRYMYNNPSYYYIYFNQLTGGLKGAFSNYETDYYYVSQTVASRWLIDYVNKNDTGKSILVKATYPVEWLFRKYPEIHTSYFRYEERSLYDWDYSIVVNRYISPFKLKNKIWPPRDAIHIEYADGVPVCAISRRKTKDDYLGYKALNEGKNDEAIDHFQKALKIDDSDEMIFYNFATALYNTGQFQKADSVLKKGLEINPGFEPILMYLGNIARTQGRANDAVGYYEKVIAADRKYFEAYVSISDLIKDSDVDRARELLKICLSMNPWYKPAILGMADTYRVTNPDIARKYEDLAGTIK